MDELRRAGPAILSPFEQKIVAQRIKTFPAQLARPMRSPPTWPASASSPPPATWPTSPRAFNGRCASRPSSITRLAPPFGFDRLRAGAGSLAAADAFERLAVRRLIEDLVGEQTALTRALIGFAASPQAAETTASAKSLVRGWTALRAEAARACQAALGSLEAGGDDWSFREADHRGRRPARTRRRRALAPPAAENLQLRDDGDACEASPMAALDRPENGRRPCTCLSH